MNQSAKSTRRERGTRGPNDPVSFLVDPQFNIYVESYFIERLCSERQRTARSGKPLLMMLLNIGQLPEPERTDTIRNVVAALSASVRETDLKGWYQNNSVIGVLFTEIGEVNQESLRAKIYAKLRDRLKSARTSRIAISFHVFPDDPADGPIGGEHDRQEQLSADNRVFYPDLTRPKLSRNMYFLTKRGMDIVGSLVCLTAFSTVFLGIAIAIKLSSRGPIIFRQERVGLFGRKFTFFKFRSMDANNDPTVHKEYVHSLIAGNKSAGNGGIIPEGNGVFKITNDSRVTTIGKFLRRTSLDELPQFINVLKGEMSLVGPRPPIPYELEKYEVWHLRRVLEVKPGISGLWQVRGRSRTTFDEMVRLDLKYLREQSLWLDLKILLQTPWAVLTAKGAH
jgi:lipopolysaccharide/colanic/teichoic acid biosynthesis glycosyltransferase